MKVGQYVRLANPRQHYSDRAVRPGMMVRGVIVEKRFGVSPWRAPAAAVDLFMFQPDAQYGLSSILVERRHVVEMVA